MKANIILNYKVGRNPFFQLFCVVLQNGSGSSPRFLLYFWIVRFIAKSFKIVFVASVTLG